VCFEPDSFPPIPVIRGAAVSHGDLVLEAADGNTFAAFASTPDEPSGVGVVILPDVRGLYRFYEELALRFAERGMSAIAFDYFGRTAGAEKRGDDFEYRQHVEQTTPEGVQADVAACIAQLTRQGARSIFTVGFCFGGRASWLAGADQDGLAGAIGFYGRPGDAIERAGEINSDPRAAGGSRPEHQLRGQRGVRSGPELSRRRARGRHVRGSAAQLLRPQAGGVRGRVRRRLGEGARLHRRTLLATS